MGDHGCRLEASSYREFADAIAVVGLEEPAGVFAVARNGAGRLLAIRAREKGDKGDHVNTETHVICFIRSEIQLAAVAPRSKVKFCALFAQWCTGGLHGTTATHTMGLGTRSNSHPLATGAQASASSTSSRAVCSGRLCVLRTAY